MLTGVCVGFRETVWHVSWECKIHSHIRDPVVASLSCSLDVLPACTRYAGSIPTSLVMNNERASACVATYVV